MDKKGYSLLLLLGIFYLYIRLFTAQELYAIEAKPGSMRSLDIYQTAVAVSQKGWSSSDYAVLVRGTDYADALSAGPLAHEYGAPLLLTDTYTLNEDTLMELKRLGVKYVLIIGGLEAVGPNIEDALQREGIITAQRISGADRYQTSARIAELFDTDEAVLTTGEDYTDAISITSAASLRGMPILLTAREELPAAAEQYLKQKKITRTYILGGEKVIGSQLEDRVPGAVRLAGDNRVETNTLILEYFYGEWSFNHIYLTDAYGGFAEGLVGGILAAQSASPMILIDTRSQSSESTYPLIITRLGLSRNSKVTVLGNENKIPTTVLESIVSYIANLRDDQTSLGGTPSVDDSSLDDVSSGSDKVERDAPDDPDGDDPDSDYIESDPAVAVTGVSVDTTDGYYREGAEITINIHFSGEVEVTGTPTLEMETGESDQKAVYKGGSGTAVLNFVYTVQTEDNSLALDYVGTASLDPEDGSIKMSSSEEDALLTLPVPGETGSISASSKIVIDTCPPSALNISSQDKISAGGYVTLRAVGGPLSHSSWLNIYNQIKSGARWGYWLAEIPDYELAITINEDGYSALIHNNNPTDDALIIKDFIISSDRVIDRAGNTAAGDIRVDSYSGD